jgi:hypothetical protein
MSIIDRSCIPSQLHNISMALQIIITVLEQADNFSCCTSTQTLPQALTGLNKE